MTLKKTIQVGVAFAGFALATSNLFAVSGTWTTAATSGDWDVASNWLDGNVPDGVGDIAAISQNVTAIRTVTLNSARTVGQLVSQAGGSANPADPGITRIYRVLGSGTLTLDNGANIPVVKGINGPFTVGVVLAGTKGVELANGGGSQTLLTAANTYTGDTEIVRGIAEIGNVNALPSFTGNGRTGNILFVDKGNGAGTLDLNGFSITINGFSSVSGGTVTTRLGTGTYTLTVGDNDQTSTFNGVINNGSGTIAFAKIGSGTQTLGGTNTYTGDTTVSGGELILADNAQLRFKIGADHVNNWITGTGSLVLDGDFNFDLTGAVEAYGNSWNIVDNLNLAETYGATFSVIGFTDQGGGIWRKQVPSMWIYEFDESTGVLTLIPEPSAFVLGLLGGLGLLVLARRRSA